MPDHADQIKLQNQSTLPASESKVADSKPIDIDDGLDDVEEILLESGYYNDYDDGDVEDIY